MQNKTNTARQKVLMYIAICLMWFSIYVYVPTLSTYCEDMGASYTLIGTILSSYGFVQMLCRLPIGILSDVTRKRKLFMLLGLGFALASGASFLLVNYPPLLVLCRALSGFCASTWAVYMISFSSCFSEEEQPKAMGLASAGMFIGQVPATFLGGVIAQMWGEQATFIAAIVTAVIGMVLFFGIAEPQIGDKQPVRLRDFARMATNRNLVFYSLMAVFMQIALYTGASGFIPNVLKDLGASNFILGLATSLSSLPAIFSSALSGSFFRQKVGAKKSLLGAFVLMAGTLAAMVITDSIWVILLILLLSGVAKGLLQSMLNSMAVEEIQPQLRSTAAAFFQSVYGIGMTIGPIVAGAIADASDMNTAFLAVAGITMIAFVCILLKKEKQHN
ncbi:MAG: MFS transporter [Clostridia bacterium]|nr:MFS transporter [Clostridia bacterium]